MQTTSEIKTRNTAIPTDILDSLKIIGIENGLTLQSLTTAILKKFLKDYEARPAIMISKINHE